MFCLTAEKQSQAGPPLALLSAAVHLKSLTDEVVNASASQMLHLMSICSIFLAAEAKQMALEGESAAQEWYKDAVLKQLSATIAADVQMLTAQHQIDTMRSAMVEIALILYRRQYHKEEEDLKTLLLSLKPEAFEAFPELIKRLTAASTRQEAKSAIITFVQDLSAPPPDLGPPEDLG